MDGVIGVPIMTNKKLNHLEAEDLIVKIAKAIVNQSKQPTYGLSIRYVTSPDCGESDNYERSVKALKYARIAVKVFAEYLENNPE